MTKRTTYSKEFKVEAVRLLELGDKKPADLARELGVSRNKLYQWREQLKGKSVEDAFPGQGRRSAQSAELAALRRENTQLKEELAFLKKSRQVLCQGILVRYAAIREHEGEFPMTTMCRALGVSRSGYYDWRRRGLSERARANGRLLDRIRRIHAQSRENYGVRKIWRALVAFGERCGRHRVARLCAAHGIAAKRMRRFRSVYRSEQRPAAPNLLHRHFHADRADRLWAGDMTFIPTREGWLCLAVLIDLYSRRVVGWAMGSKMNQALANDALIMAIAHRKPKPGLIHHSDRDVLYGTMSYTTLLNHHGMIQSRSRKGDCYDNAVVESFFANLKNELTWHCRFKTRDEAKAAVFDYIEVFYNRQRLHETLDYVSPVRYEELVVA